MALGLARARLTHKAASENGGREKTSEGRRRERGVEKKREIPARGQLPTPHGSEERREGREREAYLRRPQL
jgi:hypothetical protein